MARRTAFFNVSPRYTGGSESLVDERTALRVAQEEKEHYERALTGFYGDDEKTKAERFGLGGIVELRYEAKKGWMVKDLLTERTLYREKRPATKLLGRDLITRLRDSAGNEWQGRRQVERTTRSGHRVYVWFKGDEKNPVDLWHSDEVTVETDVEPHEFKR